MVGLLPPSSRVTSLRLDAAATWEILRPVRVLPVNAILVIWGCAAIACPTVGPLYRMMMFDLKVMRTPTVSVDDIDDARGESGLVYQAGELQCAERGEFGGLVECRVRRLEGSIERKADL